MNYLVILSAIIILIKMQADHTIIVSDVADDNRNCTCRVGWPMTTNKLSVNWAEQHTCRHPRLFQESFYFFNTVTSLSNCLFCLPQGLLLASHLGKVQCFTYNIYSVFL